MRTPIAPCSRVQPDAWIFGLALSSLALGGLGGSAQPSRLFCLLLFPYAIRNIAALLSQKWSPVVAVTLIFAATIGVLSALSVLWSVDPILTMGYSLVLVVNFTPVVYVVTLDQRRRAELYAVSFKGWLTALVLTLPLAAYELITGIHFAFSLDERGGGPLTLLLPYASVFFGNFNDYSLYLTLCISALMMLMAGAVTSVTLKWVAGLSIMMAITMVIANTSRGAMIVVGILVVAALILNLDRLKLVLMALALAMLLFIPWGIMDNDLFQFILLRFSDFSYDLDGESGRLSILGAGVKALMDSYGFGVGAGASAIYLGSTNLDIIPNPHNIFLEWALNFGILGLSIFLLHLMMLFFQLTIAWHQNRRKRSQTGLVMIALLLLPIIGVVQSHLTGYTYFWMWYATLILIVQTLTTRQLHHVLRSNLFSINNENSSNLQL